MKLSRFVLFLFVAVMAAAAAEAQCLRCVRVPPSFTQGTCQEAWPADYCHRQCCGGSIDDPCSIPDYLDPCDPWRSSGSLLTVASKRTPATRYFTTLRPIETQQEAIHRRLQELDPDAPRCGRKTARG